MASDTVLFLKQLFTKPKSISALAPSSPALTKEMVNGIGPDTGAVAELGSGTGNITQRIVDAGIPLEKIALFELNADFRELLAERFPNIKQFTDAQEVGKAPLEDVGAVISGLPLLSMPKEVQRNITRGTFELLRPGGVFVQFTYGWKPSMAQEVIDEFDLVWDVSHRIWNNLPPARVYRYRRREDVEN